MYWNIYKNLERELNELSNFVHIDDKQLEIYSIKITELLIRTVVEVESISKKLYFENGGTKPDDKDLFFDTDCLNHLENRWVLSKKIVQVTTTNFDLHLPENLLLTPLKKANKRGASSSDWLKAYQSIKHNRAKSITRGNLKNFIRALAGLYLLNLYNKKHEVQFESQTQTTNFDSNLDSSIFSVKVYSNPNISLDKEFEKYDDYDECIYLIKPTNKTLISYQEEVKKLNENAIAHTKNSVEHILALQRSTLELSKLLINKESENDIYERILKIEMEKVATETAYLFSNLKYEAILNKQQF